MKEESPWEGLTLNKCILVASFVALLSMGFQVFQGERRQNSEAGSCAASRVVPGSSLSWGVLGLETDPPLHTQGARDRNTELGQRGGGTSSAADHVAR